MIEALVLGIVQGLTEFLPVSSTAHLILVPKFFGWDGLVDSLRFDVALHAGTFLSLLICLRHEIVEMFTSRRGLLAYIIIGTVPAGLVGVLFHDYIENQLRSPYVVAIMLCVFGAVMFLSDRARGRRGLESVGLFDTIFIGIAQAFALIPGVSRSGVTISAGRAAGIRRDEAARFSFLLSLPAIAGAIVMEGRKLVSDGGGEDFSLIAAGFTASFITGVIAIRFLLKFLKTNSLNVFVVYRILLAFAVAGWFWQAG